ncbi:methyl-accepting chemotaxis protein [Halorubrum luteum]
MSTDANAAIRPDRTYLRDRIEGSHPDEEKDSVELRRERDGWRRLFYQLLEGLPEPAFIQAPDDGIVEANRAAEDVYDIPADEIAGTEPEAVFEAESTTSAETTSNGNFPTTTAIETGDSVQEDRLRSTSTASGEVTHRSAALPLSTPDGERLGAVGVTPVVTDLVDSQEQVEKIRNRVTDELPFLIDRLEEDFDEIIDHLTSTAETTEEQRDRMENVSSEIADLSASIQEVAATAEEVASESQRTRDLAAESRAEADDVVDIMDDVQAAGDEMVEEVQQLDATLEEIDAVVEAIDEIADQTNILALNASIEAARAGEAGSGFAVVAEEVKSLAEQASDQATEIESMIDDVQETSADTIDTIATTYDGLEEGINRIEVVMESLETIADAAEESAQGITEVSRATDDQAASTEEVAAVVDDLAATSKSLTAETSTVADASQYQRELIEDIIEEIEAVETLGEETDRTTTASE